MMSARQTEAVRDRLTIRRMMLLIVGESIAFAVFQWDEFDPREIRDWYYAAMCVLVGFSLPGPLIAWTARRKQGRARLGAILWCAMGLSFWITFSLNLANPRRSLVAAALNTTYYGLPLMMLSFFIAAIAGKRLTWRQLGRASRWSDRFGWYLLLGWSLLGLWLFYELGVDAFRLHSLPSAWLP